MSGVLIKDTARNLMVLMVQASDHLTGLASLTLTITASKDGAAFASISPTVTDRGNGWYNLALTSSHTDTAGDLALHITGTSADPLDLRFSVELESLKPTTAGRKLDVSAGGEAGVDWANIGSPTTTVNLSGTSTKAVEPTVAGRTLDVSTGGEAGIDWANIGSPTTVVGLSGTTVKTATDVETDTADIQSRIPAALSSGNMKVDVFALQTAALAQITAAIAAKVVTTGSQTIGGILGHVAFALWGKRTGQNGPSLTIFNDAGSPVAEIVQAVATDGATADIPSTLNNP